MREREREYEDEYVIESSWFNFLFFSAINDVQSGGTRTGGFPYSSSQGLAEVATK